MPSGDPDPSSLGRNKSRLCILIAIAFTSLDLTFACAKARNYGDPEGPRYRGGQGVPADAGPAIRVVTFNIHFGRRADRAITALRSEPSLRGADVLLLQEMDAPGVEIMAAALGMNYVYYPVSIHPKTGRDMGNAVLSPWPIHESWKVLLPHHGRVYDQARAATGARLRVGGLTLRAYSVHLTSPLGLSGSKRRQQVEAVLAHARGSADPVIIGGDFNSRSLGAYFEAQGFTWPTKSVGASVGLFSFDHVFTRGLKPAGPESAGVARNVRDASDHCPVWVDLVRD